MRGNITVTIGRTVQSTTQSKLAMLDIFANFSRISRSTVLVGVDVDVDVDGS